jgi:hypothetical protein
MYESIRVLGLVPERGRIEKNKGDVAIRKISPNIVKRCCLWKDRLSIFRQVMTFNCFRSMWLR